VTEYEHHVRPPCGEAEELDVAAGFVARAAGKVEFEQTPCGGGEERGTAARSLCGGAEE
jgi:hypothetical protein